MAVGVGIDQQHDLAGELAQNLAMLPVLFLDQRQVLHRGFEAELADAHHAASDLERIRVVQQTQPELFVVGRFGLVHRVGQEQQGIQVLALVAKGRFQRLSQLAEVTESLAYDG